MARKPKRPIPPSRRPHRITTPEGREFQHAMNERFDASSAIYQADGTMIPYVVPLEHFEDHMELDRLVCETGIKRFCRHTMPSDSPPPDHPQYAEVVGDFGEHVEVLEVRSGIRIRRPVSLEWLKRARYECLA